tara:strand:+ start:2777 stop:3976 length:1200 start_codon:yes stop_codon:yes gene_type:complete
MDISKVINDVVDQVSLQTETGMVDLNDAYHTHLVKEEMKKYLDDATVEQFFSSQEIISEQSLGLVGGNDKNISDELFNALKANNKIDTFVFFINKGCGSEDIRKSVMSYVKTITSKSDATNFAKNLGRLSKPKHGMAVKGNVEKKIYALNAKGIGTGEIWLGYVIKNGQIQGGGVSFDLLVNSTKYEVKDYATKGPSTAIRVGVEGNVAQHAFWRQVLDTHRALDKVFNDMNAEELIQDTDFIKVSKEMLGRARTNSTGEWNKTDVGRFRDFYTVASNLTAVEDTGFNQVKFIGPNQKPITKTIKPIDTISSNKQEIEFLSGDASYTQLDIVNQLRKLEYVRDPNAFQKGLDKAISDIVDKGTAAEWIIFRKGMIKVLKGASKFKFSHVSQGGVRILDL